MIQIHFKPFNSVRHFSNVKRNENDPIVQNGLSITPAEMLDLTHKGFAISAQNQRMLSEAKSPSVGVVPLEFTRGFDIADGYKAMRGVRDKARKAVDDLRSGAIQSQSLTSKSD